MVVRIISMGHPFTHEGQTVQAFTMMSSNLKEVMHVTVLVHYTKGLQGKNPNNEEEFVRGLMETGRFDGTLGSFAVAVDTYAQSLGIGAEVPSTIKQGFKVKMGLLDSLIRGELVTSLVEGYAPNEEYYVTRFGGANVLNGGEDLVSQLSERVARSVQYLSAYSTRKLVNVQVAFRHFWGQDDTIIRGLVAENVGTLAKGAGDLISRG